MTNRLLLHDLERLRSQARHLLRTGEDLESVQMTLIRKGATTEQARAVVSELRRQRTGGTRSRAVAALCAGLCLAVLGGLLVAAPVSGEAARVLGGVVLIGGALSLVYGLRALASARRTARTELF